MSDLGVNINPQTLWCPKHLEPFREHWPLGYLPASMCLFQQVMDDPETGKAIQFDAEKLDGYLAEFGPFCCKYESILPELYEFADPKTEKERFKQLLRKYSFPPPGGFRGE
jgi:hypothetical protein